MFFQNPSVKPVLFWCLRLTKPRPLFWRLRKQLLLAEKKQEAIARLAAAATAKQASADAAEEAVLSELDGLFSLKEK